MQKLVGFFKVLFSSIKVSTRREDVMQYRWWLSISALYTEYPDSFISINKSECGFVGLWVYTAGSTLNWVVHTVGLIWIRCVDLGYPDAKRGSNTTTPCFLFIIIQNQLAGKIPSDVLKGINVFPLQRSVTEQASVGKYSRYSLYSLDIDPRLVGL